MIISHSYQTTDTKGDDIVVTTHRLSVDTEQACRLGAELRERRIASGFNPWWYGFLTWLSIKDIESGDLDWEGNLYGNYREVTSYIRDLGLDESIAKRAFDVAVIKAEITPATATDVWFPVKRDDPHQIVKTQEEARRLTPPKFGEYLLYLFLTKGERINLIGDLAEEYEEVHDKFGLRKANFWYYKQVFDSLRPLIRRTIMREAQRAELIKFLRWLLELVRGY